MHHLLKTHRDDTSLVCAAEICQICITENNEYNLLHFYIFHIFMLPSLAHSLASRVVVSDHGIRSNVLCRPLEADVSSEKVRYSPLPCHALLPDDCSDEEM